MKHLLSCLPVFFFLIACDTNSQSETVKLISNDSISPEKELDSIHQIETAVNTKVFSRTVSFDKLKEKVSSKDTILIHTLVPLCDNASQGIIPVADHLGNGYDPDGNLYWGAMYGFKSYFNRSDWKLLSKEAKINENVLERVVFMKQLPSSSVVLLVADAYKGDRMKNCLHDYFNAVAGRKKESITLNSHQIGIYSYADLIIFNGHNGLMDYDLKRIPSKDSIIRETAVIGCASYEYFKPHLLASYGYPILTTSNLMAPEAYVAEGLINAWLNLKTEQEIRSSVGQAYNRYQKCGIKGATRLFYSGWQ